MKSLLYSLTAVVLLALPAHGKDLNEGQVIGHHSYTVPIQGLVEARIADKKVDVHGSGDKKFSRAEAAIELTVQVEGNLCGSAADDVSMVMNRQDGSYKNMNLSLVRLSRIEDPYRLVMRACAAYSAPRTVKVVFTMSSSVRGNEIDKRSYTMAMSETSKTVVLTHSVQNGLELNVE